MQGGRARLRRSRWVEGAHSVAEYAFLVALLSLAVAGVLAPAAPTWIAALTGAIDRALGVP